MVVAGIESPRFEMSSQCLRKSRDYDKIETLRACLKSSNEDGNEGKRENLSRNIKFAFTIFPKSAEFVEPGQSQILCKLHLGCK